MMNIGIFLVNNNNNIIQNNHKQQKYHQSKCFGKEDLVTSTLMILINIQSYTMLRSIMLIYILSYNIDFICYKLSYSIDYNIYGYLYIYIYIYLTT